MKAWTSTVAGKKRSIKIQELFLRVDWPGGVVTFGRARIMK